MQQNGSIINDLQKPKAPFSGKTGKSFFGAFVQPKLTVNQPNDVYEQEADTVADKVMRMPDSSSPDAFFKPAPIFIQRKENEDAELATESYIHTLSGGKPLDEKDQYFFGQKIGRDFSDVRIHNDSSAHQSARSIGAKAYTHGSNIVFAKGEYQPNTTEGKRLMAHELTHVVQQHSGSDIARKNVVQRSLATYVSAMNKKPPDFKTAAEHLNGENEATIKSVLANLSPDYRSQLHTAAISWPGICSRIAMLTEADYIKQNPGGDKSADKCKTDTVTKPDPTDELIDMIDNRMFNDVLNWLLAMDDASLNDTIKKLQDKNPGAIMVFVSGEEQMKKGGIQNQRVRDALVRNTFGGKARYVDSFISCLADPSSFGAPDKDRQKQGKWNLKLRCTYALSPDVTLQMYADDITDEEPTGDVLAAQQKTRDLVGGLLFPQKMNKATTPRLWQKKKQLINDIETGNIFFIIQAWQAADAVIGLVQLGSGLLMATIPAATNPGPFSGGKALEPTAPATLKSMLGEKYTSYEASYAKAVSDNVPLNGLAKEEYIAIRAYSDESWSGANFALRSNDPNMMSAQQPLISNMKSGLQKMPVHTGKVNRTVSMMTSEMNTYQEGKIVTEEGFASSSFGQSPAQREGNVAFTIESKTGRNITTVTVHNEQEVLFAPGTRFQVGKVMKFGNSSALIVLTEVP